MKRAVFYGHLCIAAQQTGRSFADILREVRALGYTHVEMDHADLLADPSIPDVLHEADLGISSIYSFFHFDADGDGNAADHLIRDAVRCGCKRIMPIPGFYSSDHSAIRQIELARMIKAMLRVCDMASEQGITVTIEDYDGDTSPILNSTGMLRFIDSIPTLYATFDTGNFIYSGEDALEAFSALQPYIRHVHLKDRDLTHPENGMPKHAMTGADLYPSAVGSGVIPIREILQRLQDMKYDGFLTVEHFDSVDMMGNIRASAAYLDTILPKGEECHA